MSAKMMIPILILITLINCRIAVALPINDTKTILNNQIITEDYQSTLLNKTFLPFLNNCDKDSTTNNLHTQILCSTYFEMVSEASAIKLSAFRTQDNVQQYLNLYDPTNISDTFCHHFPNQIPNHKPKFMPNNTKLSNTTFHDLVVNEKVCETLCIELSSKFELSVKTICRLISAGYIEITSKEIEAAKTEPLPLKKIDEPVVPLLATTVEKNSKPKLVKAIVQQDVHNDAPPGPIIAAAPINVNPVLIKSTPVAVATAAVAGNKTTLKQDQSFLSKPTEIETRKEQPISAIDDSPPHENEVPHQPPPLPPLLPQQQPQLPIKITEKPLKPPTQLIPKNDQPKPEIEEKTPLTDKRIEIEDNFERNTDENIDNMETEQKDNQIVGDGDGDDEMYYNQDSDAATGAGKQKPKQIEQSKDDFVVGDNTQSRHIPDPFAEGTDSNFFSYFMALMFLCIVVYVAYHNKTKVIALVLEGRRSSTLGRGGSHSGNGIGRRKHTAAYRKLDTNLEEAITSNNSGRTAQIIY